MVNSNSSKSVAVEPLERFTKVSIIFVLQLAHPAAVDRFTLAPKLTVYYSFIGTNVKTGDDVAIKLVSKRHLTNTGRYTLIENSHPRLFAFTKKEISICVHLPSSAFITILNQPLT